MRLIFLLFIKTTTSGWIALAFCSGIYVPQRMNCKNLIFHARSKYSVYTILWFRFVIFLSIKIKPVRAGSMAVVSSTCLIKSESIALHNFCLNLFQTHVVLKMISQTLSIIVNSSLEPNVSPEYQISKSELQGNMRIIMQ